jgi:hypothetical protein
VGAVAVLLFSGKGKICTHLFHLLKLFRLESDGYTRTCHGPPFSQWAEGRGALGL